MQQQKQTCKNFIKAELFKNTGILLHQHMIVRNTLIKSKIALVLKRKLCTWKQGEHYYHRRHWCYRHQIHLLRALAPLDWRTSRMQEEGEP